MDSVDEDVLYTMLSRVIQKRKTYPTLLMNKEKDRLSAQLQKLEQMKVELDDSEEQKRTKIAADDTRRIISRLEAPVDLKVVEHELRRKEATKDELVLFMNLRSSWDNNSQ